MKFEDFSLLPNRPGALSYLASEKYIEKVHGPVITTKELAPKVGEWAMFIDEWPEDKFWDLHENLGKMGFFGDLPNEIHPYNDIHPSAVIGKDGFEQHSGGRIKHYGSVKIGQGVSIGAHSCVDKSLWKTPTTIGEFTYIDNLVHVAHNVIIGQRCRIVAGTIIGGSVVIGNDVFIGIGVKIRPGVKIGDGVFIGMGVTVLEDVPELSRITVRNP